VIQYAIKLLVPLLHLRARLQYRAGLRDFPTSRVAAGYAKFASIVGDSRILWRIWGKRPSLKCLCKSNYRHGSIGLLPIVQWLVSLERNPRPTRALLTIERLQGWSMLAYYPLEHLSYLCSHGIIPSTIPTIFSLFSSKHKRIVLDPNLLGVWSCRFWATYVVLQFAHLWEDRKLLQQRQRALRKGKGTSLTLAEKQDLERRWDAYWSELIANVGYLPLTVHWYIWI
jgi:hypothetical protein